MRNRIVPTLAAMCLTSAGLLSAADFAPTMTIPVGEPATENVNGDGSLSIPIQPIFDGTLWDYVDGLGWNPINGIAITAASGGTWQYFDGVATFTISAPSPGDAVVLDLATWEATAALIFTPAPYSVADGVLSFRAWDGSDSAASQSTVSAIQTGGSEAYSSEERTLTVTVGPNQQASLSNPTLSRTIRAATTRTLPVAALLGEALASDPDGNPLGLAIIAVDTVGATWEWSDGGTSFPVGPGLILGPTAVITCRPNAVATATLSFVVHDSSDGRGSGTFATPDVAGELSDWSGPGDPPFSDPSNPATLTVTIANTAPEVSGGSTLTVVRGGPDQTISLTGSDIDGDTILWSAVADYTSGCSTPASPTGNPVDIVITPPTSGTANAGSIDVTADDGFGGSTLFSIAVTIQDAPVIADYENTDIVAPVPLTMVGGTVDSSIVLTVNDPDSADWTWSYSTNDDSAMAVDIAPANGSPVTITLTSSHPNATTSTVTVWAQDTDGNTSAPVDIVVSITQPANAPPAFDVLPADLALVGQPYAGLIRATDPEDDLVTLSAVVSAYVGGYPVSSPDWVHIHGNGGRATLSMTPPVGTTSVSVLWTADDPTHVGITTYSQFIDVDTANESDVIAPSLPVSSPGHPLYGAIAPGSDSGFASLRQTLAPFSAEVARGWWWSTPGRGYHDVMAALPGNGATAGAFVANTDAERQLTLTFSTLPFPAPFAIDLPAGGSSSAAGWTFFGVPPIYLNSEVSFVTSHDWGYDFRLEEADGTPFTDGADVAAALSPLAEATLSDTAPFAYDAAAIPAFSRTVSLSTGTGYWIRNHLTRPLRLVRVDSGAPYTLGSLTYPGMQGAPYLRAAPRASGTGDDAPPAPPAGQSTAKAAPAGGSCGAGGLAGLLAAAFGLIGLRRGRRS